MRHYFRSGDSGFKYCYAELQQRSNYRVITTVYDESSITKLISVLRNVIDKNVRAK